MLKISTQNASSSTESRPLLARSRNQSA